MNKKKTKIISRNSEKKKSVNKKKGHQKLPRQKRKIKGKRKKKKTRIKRVKVAYNIYGTPSNEYTMWEFQEEKRERERDRIFILKLMADNFPNLRRIIDIQRHETQKSSDRLNPNITVRHIINKLSKVEDREF